MIRVRHILACIGLVLITTGAWWLSPPWALIVIGALILIDVTVERKRE